MKMWRERKKHRSNAPKKMRPRNSMKIHSNFKAFFRVLFVIVEKWKMSAFFFIFNTYWKLISLMPYYVNIDSSLFISNLILNKSNSTIEWSTFFEAQAFMSIFDTFNRSSALKKANHLISTKYRTY